LGWVPPVVGLEVEMVGEMAAGKEVQTLVEMVVEGEYCHRRPFFVLVAETLLSSFLDFFLSLSIKQTLVIVDLPYIRVMARVIKFLSSVSMASLNSRLMISLQSVRNVIIKRHTHAMKIERILVDRGLGSKSEVLRLLQQGRVKVNEKVIRGGNHKFQEDISIRVDNKLVESVSYPFSFVVVLLKDNLLDS
jgi:hypothetical protein